MQNQVCRLTVDVDLYSADALRAVSGASRFAPLEGVLMRMLTNTTKLPEQCGYRLERDTIVTRQGDGTYRLHLHATVSDAARLLGEAAAEHRRCWGQDLADEQPDSLEQLYEVVVASNASPAPCDCGYEILSWQRVAA